MTFEHVETLLANRNLRNPQLDILKTDADFYYTLIMQPKGEIEATDRYIKGNSYGYNEKFKEFINLALTKNVGLAITPEYSCPWSIIEELVRDDKLPSENNLWVFGCQSILKENLAVMRETTSIDVIFDETVLQSTGNFLNPVCYLFRTRSNTGVLRGVLLVQFKINAMGNLNNFLERNNLISGNKIYILHNDQTSVKLATFICSDLLDFHERDFDSYIYHPCIFIHLQLNDKPRHQDMREYRRCFFSKKDVTNKEVICLNWAKGTRISSGPEISFSGSALYTKTDEIDQRDDTINSNHEHGLYYTRWANRYSHNLYFNCNEGVYYFRNTKVSQDFSAPSRAKRTGPDAIEVYGWNSVTNDWVSSAPDDGFDGLCTELGCKAPSLISNALSPLEKERLLTISCGEISRTSDDESNWYDLKRLDFFQVADSEVIKRITFTHDDDSEAQNHRSDVVLRFSELNRAVISNASNFPDCVKDLRNGSQIGYFPVAGTTDYNCNLFAKNYSTGSVPATGAFLGNSTENIAQKVFDRIASWIGSDYVRRLVVWYRKDDGKIYQKYLEEKPKISYVYIPGNSINRSE